MNDIKLKGMKCCEIFSVPKVTKKGNGNLAVDFYCKKTGNGFVLYCPENEFDHEAVSMVMNQALSICLQCKEKKVLEYE